VLPNIILVIEYLINIHYANHVRSQSNHSRRKLQLDGLCAASRHSGCREKAGAEFGPKTETLSILISFVLIQYIRYNQ
jgi:hypothetical protein